MVEMTTSRAASKATTSMHLVSTHESRASSKPLGLLHWIGPALNSAKGFATAAAAATVGAATVGAAAMAAALGGSAAAACPVCASGWAWAR